MMAFSRTAMTDQLSIYVGAVYGWYLNGDQYEFEDWLDLIMCSDEEKVMLKLKYG
jgi:hypothetical protein